MNYACYIFIGNIANYNNEHVRITYITTFSIPRNKFLDHDVIL